MTRIEEAKAKSEEARTAMNTAKKYSKKWREAEEDLNYWQGKAATYEAMEGKK